MRARQRQASTIATPTPPATAVRLRIPEGSLAASVSGWQAAAGVVLVLAGCAEVPVSMPPAPAVSTVDVVAQPALPAAEAGSALAERSRAAAEQFEASGRWGEAAAQWEVLAMVRPTDNEASRRASQARSRARDEARARSAVAAQARARGDLDTAVRGYLLALAAEPDNAAAARALREIEFERTRRTQLARGNRSAALEPAWRAPAGRSPGAVSGAPAAAGSGSSAASLVPADEGNAGLATAAEGNGEVRSLDEGITAFRQGDYERASTLLQAFLQRNPTDEEARGYLRDALVRSAQQRAAAGRKEEALRLYEQARSFGDRNASDVAPAVARLRKELADDLYRQGLRAKPANLQQAVALWERSLQFDPGNALVQRELELARKVERRAPALK